MPGEHPFESRRSRKRTPGSDVPIVAESALNCISGGGGESQVRWPPYGVVSWHRPNSYKVRVVIQRFAVGCESNCQIFSFAVAAGQRKADIRAGCPSLAQPGCRVFS